MFHGGNVQYGFQEKWLVPAFTTGGATYLFGPASLLQARKKPSPFHLAFLFFLFRTKRSLAPKKSRIAVITSIFSNSKSSKPNG